MWTQTLDEIRSYFSHGDYPLAVRRTLDAAFDTDDKTLIREAVDWGRETELAFLSGKPLENRLQEKGVALLEKMKSREGKRSEWFGETYLYAGNVQKKYGSGSFVLLPFDLTIKAGDVIGVVGENGNGKTTLLRILSGYLHPNSGNLNYYFQKDSQPDYYRIKQEVAFIPQRIPRWYGTLKDNLNFYASSNGFYGEENELMTDFMLTRFGLTRFANFTWNQLSSGYRTRFEIAKILLKRPKLLVLDEPLANLDINAQQTILNDLRALSKSTHKPMGVILSSQQLHEVEKIADSVLFIKNGKLLHSGKQEKQALSVLEVEIRNERIELENLLSGRSCTIKFNGGYYVISSEELSASEMLKMLVNSELTISYSRDITHSTKRFF
ncbi:MAG: ABC transporter ATP-binding protein [Flavobacteriales bacterium]|nr:ABC transporter ATP-binding protein [Flavobacteriales bacterium]